MSLSLEREMAGTDTARPKENWHTLLVCPDGGMAGQFLPLMPQVPGLAPVTEMRTYPPAEALGEFFSGRQVNPCFLDASTNKDTALALIADLLRQDPALQIVVLLASTDSDFILRCLRQGATGFLTAPFTAGELEPVMERLARMRPETYQVSQAGGKVYCVMPAKGGCGATTLAFHLAHQWKRNGSKRILLADLDPLTGTVSFALKLTSAYSFMDALQRGDSVDVDIWKALVASWNGLDVLLSPEDPARGIGDLPDPGHLIEFAKSCYDIVVLDTSGVYGNWNGQLAAHADEVLLVMTNELPAIQAGQRALSYLERGKVDRSRIRVVVNRFSEELGVSGETIETALKLEVCHTMPSDYDAIQKATMEGKTVPPRGKFGKSLAALSAAMTGGSELPDEEPKSSALGKVLSLFARRR